MYNPKQILMQEYTQNFNYIFRCFELTGFSRFIIRKGKIVERNFWATVYNIFIIFIVNAGAVFLLQFADLTQYLTSAEVITILEFLAYSNALLFHNTFINKGIGAEIMRYNIEIDHFFGINETKQVRNGEIKFYTIVFIIIMIGQFSMVSIMWYLFDVSISIHVVGTLYFIWLVFPVDDFCFLAYLCIFLARRARVLNVALIKMTNMKMEYVPMHSIFFKLFWNMKHDSAVSFHVRENNDDFIIGFKMLFSQFRRLERCYLFPLLVGITTIVVNSFVTVHTYVMYLKTSVQGQLSYYNSLKQYRYVKIHKKKSVLLWLFTVFLQTSIIRASVITAFTIISWLYIIMMSIMIGMFYDQIQQSKLICSYIQLKPTSTAKSLRLTKKVLQTLEIRDARLNCYDVFFTSGLIMQIVASTFVYITVQLQLAFPDRHNMDNDTETVKYELDVVSARNYVLF